MGSFSTKLAVSNRLRSTPFTQRIIEDGAAAFTVYNHMLLPTEFEGLEQDYWHLCSQVQVWDVGAERQVSLSGKDAQKLAQWMTPRDLSKAVVGQCVYAPIADRNGYLLNDPVALKISEDHWWLSLADSDILLWADGLATGASLDVKIEEPNVWPLAVQGPKAEQLMQKVFGDDVKNIRFFRFKPMKFNNHEFNVARSGWSKQGGFEIYVDDADIGLDLYNALFEAGRVFDVKPGCPNLIERMESGLLSYGNDMTADHTVLESGLANFISLDADIDSLSVAALRQEASAGPKRQIKGMVFPAAKDQGVIATSGVESNVSLASGTAIGRLGSQVWSPRYQAQLATVMLDAQYLDQGELDIMLDNGKSVSAKVAELPFDFAALGIKAQR